MNIFIDGRTIKQNPSGVGKWNLCLVRELLKKPISKIFLLLPNNCSYDFFSDKNLFSKEINKKLILIKSSPPYQFVNKDRFLFEQFTLNKLIQKINPDIFHATDSFGIPFNLNKKIATILTIHDLIPLTPYRELMSFPQYILYKISLNISIKKAQKIVAISDNTKKDIIKYLRLKENEISVIYNGVDRPSIFSSKNEKNRWQELSKNLKLTQKKYILYYGGFGKRRNIPTLIESFNQLLQKKIIPQDFKLVLSGRIINAKSEHLKNLLTLKTLIKKLHVEKNIIFLDYLNDLDKAVLIKNALFFCSLSLYEGFGLTPIEVLVYHIPAIFTCVGIWYSYNKPSNFIINNPLSKNEIIEKMTNLIKNKFNFKNDYNNLLSFIDNFSWKKMVDEYYNLYKNLLFK
ncbi:MAG: glycosyltransferase family 4 protein [Patescibacteria group bacterium]|nr:glycosyltransferase family 4 protein [Patescibacteria group bacterium]